jgi:hypothetical protein
MFFFFDYTYFFDADGVKSSVLIEDRDSHKVAINDRAKRAWKREWG